VLEYFGAEHDVETVVAERKRRDITLHALDAGVLDARSDDVQCDDDAVSRGEQAGKVPIPRSDIQRDCS